MLKNWNMNYVLCRSWFRERQAWATHTHKHTSTWHIALECDCHLGALPYGNKIIKKTIFNKTHSNSISEPHSHDSTPNAFHFFHIWIHYDFLFFVSCRWPETQRKKWVNDSWVWMSQQRRQLTPAVGGCANIIENHRNMAKFITLSTYFTLHAA